MIEIQVSQTISFKFFHLKLTTLIVYLKKKIMIFYIFLKFYTAVPRHRRTVAPTTTDDFTSTFPTEKTQSALSLLLLLHHCHLPKLITGKKHNHKLAKSLQTRSQSNNQIHQLLPPLSTQIPQTSTRPPRIVAILGLVQHTDQLHCSPRTPPIPQVRRRTTLHEPPRKV